MASTKSPSITVRKVAAAAAKVDAVVVGVYPADNGVGLISGADEVDAAMDGKLVETLNALGAKGKGGEVTLLPSGGALTAPVVAAVGLGAEQPSPEVLRRGAGSVMRRLAGTARTTAFALTCTDDTAVGALSEGVLLGAYTFDRYRSNNARRPVGAVTLLGETARDKGVKAALARAQAVGRAVNLTRDWINVPPSDLYPAVFADQARAEAKRAGLDVEVLDKRALASAGYGGILGVGQGSTHGPRLVRVTHRHAKAKKHLMFVGKGVTFDSGGLSLKPNDSMVTMKSDMSGAAAVLAAASAVAELDLPVNLTAWAPMVENMPSGTAQRPSDVLTMYGGKTVEVLNTDAEGRLILADVLARVSEDQPDAIVDIATLTGACIVALGQRVFGIMSNDDGLQAKVRDVATRAGEDGWPLPIPEGTRERLDSKVADLANVASSRPGGAVVAASFLAEFVGAGIPWAHLDIAGPSYNDGAPWGYTPTGATGSGVRTLVGLAEAAAAGDL